MTPPIAAKIADRLFDVPGIGALREAAESDHERQVLACGPAGSVILYNGSVWHGHAANQTGESRRSIQGAYIRRHAESWVDQAARIRPETLSRVGPLAKHVLAV